MLIRRPDVSHRQHGSLIRPRPLMIPELVFMNVEMAKQTWQQNNRKTTETAGCDWWINAKHHQIEIIPPHQLGQAAAQALGVRGQADRSPTLDPLTNICGQTRLSPWFPDAEWWTDRRLTLGSTEALSSEQPNQWSHSTALSVKLKQPERKENNKIQVRMENLPESTAA